MSFNKILTVIFMLFISLSCTAKDTNTNKEKTYKEKRDDIEQTINNLDFQWLNNENDFYVIMPSEKIKTKEGKVLEGQEKIKVFNSFWDHYFQRFFIILKVNFYYDETFKIGVYGEEKEKILKDLEIKINSTNSDCDDKDANMCKYKKLIDETKTILLYYALKGKDLKDVNLIIENNKKEALKMYLKEF